jgi:integrase
VVRGVSREHWADASPVRAIFKTAFARVGLPYFRPHTVRNTLTQLAYRLRLGLEELKAWSQNLGHSSVATTLQGYGHVTAERQGEILAKLPRSGDVRALDPQAVAKTLEELAAALLNQPAI